MEQREISFPRKNLLFIILIAAFLSAAVAVLNAEEPLNDEKAKQENTVKPAEKTRIGTFDRTRLLKAFYDSRIWADRMSKIFDKFNEAEKKNDRKTMVEMKAKAEALEEIAKKQMKGVAPLHNIYEYIWPKFAAIAAEANVEMIVERPLYRSRNVRIIDITDILCKQFPPAEKKTAK